MKLLNNRLIRWLRNILIILAIIIGVSFALLVVINLYVFKTATPCNEDYPSAFLDKKKLLQTTHSPRLILVGDSGVAFGINSAKMTEQLGIETLNLGVTSILTGRFTMESTKPYIQDGDIILLSLALPQWADTPRYGEAQFDKPGGFDWLWKIVVLDSTELRSLTTLPQWIDVIGSNLKELQNRLNPEKSKNLGICTDRRRFGFNERGDFVAWIDKPNPNKDFSQHDLGTFNTSDHIFSVINDYASYARSNGAAIYYLPTVLSRTVYDNHKTVLNDFNFRLTTDLDFPVLGDIETFVFDDKYIYDAIFHPTGEGREIYTDMVIERLRAILDVQ